MMRERVIFHSCFRTIVVCGALFHPLAALASADGDEDITLAGDELTFAEDAFEEKCSLCHEDDGNAADVRLNLVDNVWNHGGNLAGIERTIGEGVADSKMKPHKGKYTAEQVTILARFVKLLRQRHAKQAQSDLESATELTDKVAPELSSVPRVEPIKRNNFIDDFIFEKIEADGIPNAGLSSDAEFLRRVHLDLWGRLPDPDAVRTFIADTDSDKRNKLIDHLLGFDQEEVWDVPETFLSKWTFFFGNLFKNNSRGPGHNRAVFKDYIHQFLKYNAPYDRVVREMLTATALNARLSGAAGFLLPHEARGQEGKHRDGKHEDTCDELAVATTKVLLGVNLQCISCHDGSPHLNDINLWLSRRKRLEFWRQATFFEHTRIFHPGEGAVALLDGPPSLPSKEIRSRRFDFSSPFTFTAGAGYRMDAPSMTRMPRDKTADVSPEYIFTKERPAAGANPRVELARILTGDFQFAKHTVNLLWSNFMTVGIVDPPFNWDLDRQDPQNPPPSPWTIQPSHPELLVALAKDFVDNNFDFRRLMRTICRSSAYQLSSLFEGEYKAEYDRYYARKLVRRLWAEEIYDAMAKATNVFGHDEQGVHPGTTSEQYTTKWSGYAMDLSSPLIGLQFCDYELNNFLFFLGRGDRTTKEPDTKLSIVQASAMLYSKLVKRKVSASTEKSRVNTLLTKHPPWTWGEPKDRGAEKVVEELFLATLTRYPTQKEMAESVAHLRKYRDLGVEDLQWALINKLEFMVNY